MMSCTIVLMQVCVIHSPFSIGAVQHETPVWDPHFGPPALGPHPHSVQHRDPILDPQPSALTHSSEQSSMRPQFGTPILDHQPSALTHTQSSTETPFWTTSPQPSPTEHSPFSQHKIFLSLVPINLLYEII